MNLMCTDVSFFTGQLMPPPVVEVADAPKGITEIKVKTALGVRIGFFQIDASTMDDELMADIKSWQRRRAGVALILVSGESA